MSRDRHVDPSIMALRGRIGAHTMHARHDPKETTAHARAVFLGRFDQEADPDGVLPEAERARRAEQLRRAYFARLAYLSAVKRRRGPGVPGASQGRASSPRSE